MELKKVVQKLEEFASPSLAESWDNVGLLTEPTAPHVVKKMLLTNDLTSIVLDEAVEKNVDMILSYHPPIFSALKRLTQRSWKEKLIVKCIERRIAVYSPHTCCDALKGGVNDWLIGAFETKCTKPVTQSETVAGAFSCQIDIVMESERTPSLVAALQDKSIPRSVVSAGIQSHGKTDQGLTEIRVCCTRSDVPRVVEITENHGGVVSMQKQDIGKVPLVGYGMGRVGKLKTPLSLSEAVEKVKNHLKLQHVRLAASPDMEKISSVAVCAGSGSSVLLGAKADLFVTGEMSHHDVLNAVSKGISVILCEHSNTERGYLHVLREKLSPLLTDQVEITVSETDSDPLKIV